MNDSEILDQVGNMRVRLAAMVDGVDASDHARLLVAASLFIAGVDACLAMREE